MAYFAVEYTYTNDDLDQIRPLHRQFLQGLADQDIVVMSGPRPGTTPPSALLILRAEDSDTVVKVLDDDPFKIHGLIQERTIYSWDPVIGILTN